MNILFLCTSNIFRSQVAEAFFNKFSENHKAKSAALEKTQDHMHRLVIKAMAEEGIDIEKNISEMVTKDMLEKADLIIFMNKNLKEYSKTIKPFLKKDAKIEFWEIPDVFAKETDEYLYPKFVEVRNIIKSKVSELLSSISP